MEDPLNSHTVKKEAAEDSSEDAAVNHVEPATTVAVAKRSLPPAAPAPDNDNDNDNDNDDTHDDIKKVLNEPPCGAVAERLSENHQEDDPGDSETEKAAGDGVAVGDDSSPAHKKARLASPAPDEPADSYWAAVKKRYDQLTFDDLMLGEHGAVVAICGEIKLPRVTFLRKLARHLRLKDHRNASRETLLRILGEGKRNPPDPVNFTRRRHNNPNHNAPAGESSSDEQPLPETTPGTRAVGGGATPAPFRTPLRDESQAVAQVLRGVFSETNHAQWTDLAKQHCDAWTGIHQALQEDVKLRAKEIGLRKREVILKQYECAKQEANELAQYLEERLAKESMELYSALDRPFLVKSPHLRNSVHDYQEILTWKNSLKAQLRDPMDDAG